MKKLIFGIFAHPDDEAFGPAGTLLKEVRQGAELHLIMLTPGQAGENPDSVEDLAEVRLGEWHEAAKKMGAHSLHNLDFIDGQLSNDDMIAASKKIEKIVRDAASSDDLVKEVEFISMDTNGLSGHIDHIVASRAAHYVFYKLKDEGLSLTRLRLACIPREQTSDRPNLGFVFMEPGRLPEEIDEVVDNRDLVDEVYEIMRIHHTQRSDGESHIKKLGDRVAIDHFIVKT